MTPELTYDEYSMIHRLVMHQYRICSMNQNRELAAKYYTIAEVIAPFTNGLVREQLDNEESGPGITEP